MTVQLADGTKQRIRLACAPAHPLPALALDALRAVLPSAAWRAILASSLTRPGAICQSHIQAMSVRTSKKTAAVKQGCWMR